ncbi:DUF4421 family protein [Lutimonas sp.]|uniref:DUF4421 family protein n=1 Tax=Lutimonas sp. TaxID=1872403 RepID=UPI003D9BBAB5
MAIALLLNIYTVSAQEKVDSLETSNDTIPNSYIIDFKTRFNVKLEVSNEIASFNIIENGIEANLKPSLNLRYGVVFSYKFLSIRIGIRPKISDSEKEEKGDTDTFRLKLQLLFDHWNHVIEYNNYRGFYVDNSTQYMGNQNNNYIQFPGLTTHVLFGSSVYKFNKNYSMRAIQSQTEIQKKSAGSFMPGISYNFYSISGTDKIKNLDGDDEITYRDYYNEYEGINLSLQLGYYYTFVLKDYWFANAFGIPAAGVDFYTTHINSPEGKTDRSYSDSFLTFSYGFGGGYNGNKIFFGANYKNRFTNEKFTSSRLHIIPTKHEFSVYFGYRFKAPKTVTKPVDLIEEKVPILKDDH